MRKHNEGYTLAMVMVVITVLCLVTVSVLTASVQNLKAQRTSLDRLNAKYEAQGLMETLIGRLEQGIVCEDVDTVVDAETAARDWLESCGMNDLAGAVISYKQEEQLLTCKTKLSYEKTVGEYTYTVDADVTITAKLELKDAGIGGHISKYTYTVSGVAVEYTSYEIGGSAA